MANEIVITDLAKNFADVQAVNGLNLEIRKGELFGLLGPNGAGKHYHSDAVRIAGTLSRDRPIRQFGYPNGFTPG